MLLFSLRITTLEDKDVQANWRDVIVTYGNGQRHESGGPITQNARAGIALNNAAKLLKTGHEGLMLRNVVVAMGHGENVLERCWHHAGWRCVSDDRHWG